MKLQWPKKPFIYQINTWVWLNRLSERYGEEIKLHNVPDEVIGALANLNVDAIWLMGVWYRSPSVRASALNYIHEYRPALPDITEDDVPGSAYAIGAYQVDERIGGGAGLADLRERFHRHGLRLILDFVPNHVAVDHPWVYERPDYFIQGDEQLLRERPGDFYETTDASGERRIIGHGRDPYFPGWIDTAQLNVFNADCRQAVCETLLSVASQCDGVRCDMAMLVMNDVFLRTWEDLAGPVPSIDYWEELIPIVRAQYPDFLFIAEAYWGMEYALQQQGFDYTYDKTLYDRIQSGDANGIYQHLLADISFQNRSVRFIENHDEARAAASLGIAKSRAAAVLICTVPGAVLLHDGQFVGNRVKLPVQISRGPQERPNRALAAFYARLLSEMRDAIYRNGQWTLFNPEPAYEGDSPHVLAYGWHDGGEYVLITVNITPEWAQALIKLSGWEADMARQDWLLYDTLGDAYSEASGDQIVRRGLYIELQPYEARIYHFSAVRRSANTEDFAQAERS